MEKNDLGQMSTAGFVKGSSGRPRPLIGSASPEPANDAAPLHQPGDLVPADGRGLDLVDVGGFGFGFASRAMPSLPREFDADGVGGRSGASEEGSDLAPVRTFTRRSRIGAQSASHVSADMEWSFLRGLRRWGRRRAVRARTWQGLAGDAVVVAVQGIGVARQQVFLRFRLIREVRAVVVEGLRRRR